MINRVLIRIKVVQMLYCYLLTHSEFKLQDAPEGGSRDKKYAYTLYCDLLLLILRLSGYRTSPKGLKSSAIDSNKYLSANKISKLLASDSEMKALGVKSEDMLEKYGEAVYALFDEITHSAIYRSYTHTRNHNLESDVTFWVTLLNTVIAKSPEFIAAARKSESYTIAGFEQGIAMAADSLTRITDSRMMFVNARQALKRSLDEAYKLYHALLALPLEITRFEDLRLDNARNKFLATAEDLNPNTRFVDNALVKILGESEEMKSYFNDNPFNWSDYPEFIRSIHAKVVESQLYADYMAAGSTDLEKDCDFWRAVMKNIILPSDDLAELLESMSVYWNDDLDITGTFVIKTIKRIGSGKEGKILLPQYKDDEDASFGSELFVDTIENFDLYRSYIDKFIDARQWDTDRLAFMDVVIMATAIDELLHYPAIPIPVTLNEYIEIANCYSTPRSGQFVNGILYSVINYLKEEGKLNKN